MRYQTKIKILCFCNTIVPLLAGILIYVFIREGPLIANIENRYGIFRKLRELVYFEYYPVTTMGIFFKYHFTDFLWAYAFGWATAFKRQKKLLSIIRCICFVTFFEIVQLLPVMESTFDFADVVIQIIGVLFAFFVFFTTDSRL